jgi:hypothetical protein
MKKITTIALAFLFTLQAIAQKEVKLANTYETIDGDLVTTLHTVSDGKATGTKEIYSYKNTLYNSFTFSELCLNTDGTVSALYKYSASAENIEIEKCFVSERNTGSFEEKQLFVLQIAMKKGTNVVVQSLIGNETDWTYTKEPIGQIYFATKAAAEKVLEELKKK